MKSAESIFNEVQAKWQQRFDNNERLSVYDLVEMALNQRDKEWTDKIKEAIKEETYFRAQEALKKLLDNKDKND